MYWSFAFTLTWSASYKVIGALGALNRPSPMKWSLVASLNPETLGFLKVIPNNRLAAYPKHQPSKKPFQSFNITINTVTTMT